MRKNLGYIVVFFMFFSFIFAFSNLFENFENKDNINFLPIVGAWHLQKDGNNTVYVVDGRKWVDGTLSKNAKENSKKLFGKSSSKFFNGIKYYRRFPLTIFTKVKNFTNGKISVKFKAISGKIDQGAGIAFNIKDNGSYLVIRANPLENNLVCFRLKNRRRSVVKWRKNVKTPSKTWHTLSVIIKGKKIEGYLNGKKYLEFYTEEPISGRIGLWSKSDSYVYFDNFKVESEK